MSDCPHGYHPEEHCSRCVLGELADLRARLAAAEKERDEAKSEEATWRRSYLAEHNKVTEIAVERDALRAQLATLRDATAFALIGLNKILDSGADWFVKSPAKAARNRLAAALSGDSAKADDRMTLTQALRFAWWKGRDSAGMPIVEASENCEADLAVILQDLT